jgi:periplasmic divalent cation tolerance protein
MSRICRRIWIKRCQPSEVYGLAGLLAYVVTEFVIVLTTLPLESDAEKFASLLVEEKLAACVNILPAMRSVYRWKDAIERSDERQLVIKTVRARVIDLEARIRQLHPYEVPEFVVLPIDSGSPAYLSWISDSTS